MKDKSKKNWAVFKDNEPKYKVDDLVLYNYPRMVGIIREITKEPITEEEKKFISDWRSEQRGCCGQRGRGIIEKNFYYEYRINGELISEDKIAGVGVDSINEHLKELNNGYDKLNERISTAVKELGYNNDY